MNSRIKCPNSKLYEKSYSGLKRSPQVLSEYSAAIRHIKMRKSEIKMYEFLGSIHTIKTIRQIKTKRLTGIGFFFQGSVKSTATLQ